MLQVLTSSNLVHGTSTGVKIGGIATNGDLIVVVHVGIIVIVIIIDCWCVLHVMMLGLFFSTSFEASTSAEL